jgi:hypothetical protein
MLLDFEVRSCSRCCAETGKTLQPGEVYFSVLELQEAETIRRDFCAEAWQKPSQDNLGWWRSRVPVKDEKPRLAPTDIMLNLFIALAGQPADSQFRYLLGLLLIRRRVLKREDSRRNDSDQEVLTLFASRRDERYELIVDEPDQGQAEHIQQRMIELLYGDGDSQSQSTAAKSHRDSDSPSPAEAA